jgi:hypothetical protein
VYGGISGDIDRVHGKRGRPVTPMDHQLVRPGVDDCQVEMAVFVEVVHDDP